MNALEQIGMVELRKHLYQSLDRLREIEEREKAGTADINTYVHKLPFVKSDIVNALKVAEAIDQNSK